MSILISDEDVTIAVRLLKDEYKMKEREFDLFFVKSEWKATVDSYIKGGNQSDFDRKLHFYIQKEGINLLKNADFRKRILDEIEPEAIQELFDKFVSEKEKGKITTKGHQVPKLAKLKWISGSRWPRAFTIATKFPNIFAGIKNDGSSKSPAIEKVSPRRTPPKLKSYQVEVKNQMKKILELDGDKSRSVISLPTGGGKTRVAVEAFIEWMQPRFSEGKFMIWIAQSEELCEQAATCIAEMWSHLEYPEDLNLIRYFGSNEVSIEDDDVLNGGAVVVGINQLHYRIKNDDEFARFMIANTGAIIIDEAHRAVTSMYRALFGFAEDVNGKINFPVCGLTATPGRASGEETNCLVEMFQVELIKPDLSREADYNPALPMEYFKKKGYLARAVHEKVSYVNKTFSEKELADFRESYDLNMELDVNFSIGKKKLLRELAIDDRRNAEIIKRLKEIPDRSKTIVYACTVEHAENLAAIMNYYNRKSYAISANTNHAVRRKLIEEFKDGDVEFIFNYSVLTTGFDAPKTDHIVLCRPILGDILYEQIVGRGLRGPTFGGTAECKVIDFEDTIFKKGISLAYTRFEDYWEESVKENEKV